MDNLPDTVQWLLDFANLGSNPGELNPQKQDKILTPEVSGAGCIASAGVIR